MPSLLRTRRSKYGNKRVRLPGEARPFDSQHEAGEFVKLKMLESRGVIGKVSRQVPFELAVNDVKITTYRADFTWREPLTGNVIVADAKGYPTPEYKIKKALMKAIHGIDIREL